MRRSPGGHAGGADPEAAVHDGAAEPDRADWKGVSKGLLMDGWTDQRTVLLLLVGSSATYVASEHPSFGTALLVGVGVVTLLHLLMKNH
jgi:hypothetical protein